MRSSRRNKRTSRRNAWKPIHLGSNMCLDVEGGNKRSRARMISYGCHSGPNQLFRRTRRGELQAKHSRKCLDPTTFTQKKCK
jgi:hypothetical protein